MPIKQGTGAGSWGDEGIRGRDWRLPKRGIQGRRQLFPFLFGPVDITSSNSNRERQFIV